MEPIATGAVIALAMGIVKVLEVAVTALAKKVVPEKRNESSGLHRIELHLERIDGKLDAFSENMLRLAEVVEKASSNVERQSCVIDRLESRLEKQDLLEAVELQHLKSVQKNGA